MGLLFTAARRFAWVALCMAPCLCPVGKASAQGAEQRPSAAVGLAGPSGPVGLSDGEFNRRVLAARDAAGVDPRQGLAALRRLRNQVDDLQPPDARLQARLVVDEAECRVLGDYNKSKAVPLADAGLALAGPVPGAAARSAWLRLRLCRAGALGNLTGPDQAQPELQAVLAATSEPEDVAVHALALMERGVYRSRSGDLQGAQRDLLPACEALKTRGPGHDHELCLSHLANHYRRVGDLDESLRLQVQLRDRARQRSATYDDSIYTYGVAQVQQAMQQWSEAIDNYQAASAASEKLDDRTGVSYAVHGVATSLLQLKRPAEALLQATKALDLLDRTDEPRQHAYTSVTVAEAHIALERFAQARPALDDVAAAVRQLDDRSLLAQWLVAQSAVMRSQGRWNDAYQALAEARRIEDQLYRQQLSEQSARLRMQFNRQRDADDLSALRLVNEQGQRLRQTQAVALALFITLLVGVAVLALRKVRLARRLHNLASTDELTGLANRRALTAAADAGMAQAGQTGTPLALLMVDVDHFKQINDTYGHAFGDEVLRHLARVLTAGLRDQDRLGRLGGEEFLAVLPSASLDDASRVAERMRAAVAAAPVAGPNGPVVVTVSIGVAGGRAASAAELIARADAAMYRAKHAGRNAVTVEGAQPAPAAST